MSLQALREHTQLKEGAPPAALALQRQQQRAAAAQAAQAEAQAAELEAAQVELGRARQQAERAAAEAASVSEVYAAYQADKRSLTSAVTLLEAERARLQVTHIRKVWAPY
jgi:hypothetical protein